MAITDKVKPKEVVGPPPVPTPPPDDRPAQVFLEPTPYLDPFHPTLKDSPSLYISPEQDFYVKWILEICCSDSAFAKKAYQALQVILTGEEPVASVVSSLTPSTAVVSTPVSLVVAGTGFTATSVISFGGPVATTFVSDTELSASVTAPGTEGVVPVTVITDGLISNSVDFTVTAVLALRAPVESKKDELKKEEEFYTPKKDEKK